jgi:hypothetical protein
MRRQDLAIILLSGDTRWNASVSVCRADLRRYLLEAKQSYSSHPYQIISPCGAVHSRSKRRS